MATRYIKSVAKYCHVQAGDLGVDGHYEIPAQKHLVEDFILKETLKPGKASSEEFMAFMAEWGTECIQRDAETGNLLMELALQRISKAVPHASYDLPETYRKYIVNDAEKAPMTAACWLFIQDNLRYCVEDIQDDAPWRRHAELILLGLFTCLNEDGSTNNDLQWNEAEIGTSVKDAYKWVENLAGMFLDFYEVVPTLAPYWRKKRHYFKYVEDVVDWSNPLISKAFKHDAAVDKDGHPYFSKRTKIFLKILGLYQFTLIQMIRQDMRVVK